VGQTAYRTALLVSQSPGSRSARDKCRLCSLMDHNDNRPCDGSSPSGLEGEASGLRGSTARAESISIATDLLQRVTLVAAELKTLPCRWRVTGTKRCLAGRRGCVSRTFCFCRAAPVVTHGLNARHGQISSNLMSILNAATARPVRTFFRSRVSERQPQIDDSGPGQTLEKCGSFTFQGAATSGCPPSAKRVPGIQTQVPRTP
jgi:hypothetical protein